MKQSILQTFKIGLATFMAIVLSGVVPTGVALAATENGNPPSNNGTLQVHEFGDEDYKPGNDPKVCHFNFEVFGLDANQTGNVYITK